MQSDTITLGPGDFEKIKKQIEKNKEASKDTKLRTVKFTNSCQKTSEFTSGIYSMDPLCRENQETTPQTGSSNS